MNEFIYETIFSIPDELCNEIIRLFEEENTFRFILNNTTSSAKWIQIYNFLSKECVQQFDKYSNRIIEKCRRERDNGVSSIFNKKSFIKEFINS